MFENTVESKVESTAHANTPKEESTEPTPVLTLDEHDDEETVGVLRQAIEKQIAALKALLPVADRIDSGDYQKKRPLFDDAKALREGIQKVKQPIHEIRNLTLDVRNEKVERIDQLLEREEIAKLKEQQAAVAKKLEEAMQKLQKKGANE